MGGRAEYEFVVAGSIGPRTVQALELVEVVSSGDGQTRLRGWIADQGALHGVLERMRDLRVELLDLHRLR